MSTTNSQSLPSVEYSLKSISWHAKKISEALERQNSLLEEIKSLFRETENNKKAQVKEQPAIFAKNFDECPF
jgi:hypothetical protein